MLDLKGQPELLERKAHRVIREAQAHRARQVLDHKVLKVTPDPQEFKVQPGQERKALKASRVCKASRDSKETKVHPGQERKARKALKAQSLPSSPFRLSWARSTLSFSALKCQRYTLRTS